MKSAQKKDQGVPSSALSQIGPFIIGVSRNYSIMTMAASIERGEDEGVARLLYYIQSGFRAMPSLSLPHRPQKRVQALGASPGLPCHLGLETFFRATWDQNCFLS